MKTLIILGAAALVTAAMRRNTAAERCLVWIAAFGAILAMPVLTMVAPPLAAPPIVISVQSMMTAAPERAGIPWAALLEWIWAAGATLLVLRAVFDFVAAWRIVRAAEPRALHGVAVWITQRRISPMVWSFFGTRIVLPAEALSWTSERMRAVLAHEAAHVERADCWVLAAARLAVALNWMNPLVWFGWSRLSREMERACDDVVLSAGVRAADYAEHLLEIARGLAPMTAAPAMIGRSKMEGRMMHILNGNVNRRGLSRAAYWLAAALAGAAVLPVAGMQSVRVGKFVGTAPFVAAATQDEEKVYKIGPGITHPKVIHRVEPQYTPEAKDSKTEGTVILGVEISAEGQARNITVKKGIDAGLDQNGVDAVKQWRFAPATKDGKPVAVFATIEINFKLK